MDERTKRKAEDELTEIVNEYKRGKLSIDTENGRRIEEKSPGRPSPLELPGVRHSSGHPPENGHPLSSRQVSCEVRVDVVDKNTLIWLESKQNALLFNDEYGIFLDVFLKVYLLPTRTSYYQASQFNVDPMSWNRFYQASLQSMIF